MNCRFQSLKEVESSQGKIICVHTSLHAPLLQKGYLSSTIKPSDDSDAYRLKALADNDGCDAVVISSTSLNVNARKAGDKACDVLFPLFNDEVLEMSTVFPISPALGEIGNELVSRMNLLILGGRYSREHLAASNEFEYDQCTFSAFHC